MNGRSEQELNAAVRAARDDYRTLNSEFDALLLKAHTFVCGSREMIEALRKANELAPRVREALQRYSEALQALTVFYQKQRNRQTADGPL